MPQKIEKWIKFEIEIRVLFMASFFIVYVYKFVSRVYVLLEILTFPTTLL